MTIHERLSYFLGTLPDIEQAAFVADSATVHGAITLGEDSSIFYGAILRGDIQTIKIGKGTNIQDGSIIHLADDYGVEIGEYTTVGHGAMIHACKIGNECLIGMRSTILDGAEIGDHCIIAAGAVVTPRTIIPPGSMVMGAPGKIKRPLTPQEIAGLRPQADKYVIVAKAHAARQAALAAAKA